MIGNRRKLLKIFVIVVTLATLSVFVQKSLLQIILGEPEDDEKIDWNDYEFMKVESRRKGFGEHGKGEKLSDPEEIRKNKELFKTFGMSVVISDKISVNRSIPDYRHPQCLKRKYFRDLPQVSIIIIFNNEIFSVFKRTLHSLYNRTPHQLVKEVILVNDNSTLEHLYDPLKNYIVENFRDMKFKIINLNKRHGLMKARVIGAKAAESEFLFVMEPHCEMTYNWLPPLIEPLLNKKRMVTVPIIDYIEYNRLRHYSNGHGSRGVFDWDLQYKQLPRFSIEKSKRFDPFPIPIMTGGIYMIRKDYFFEIGPYDEELLIWGAENIEMSFKINLCGGRLYEVPCSRIGHVFRAFNKFRKHESGIDFVAHNNKRIAEVWLGSPYKEYVYERNPERYKIDAGNLRRAKAFKERLQCDSFQYFLDAIAPDLLENFPPMIASFAHGTVRLLNTTLCLDTYLRRDEEPLGLFECDTEIVNSRRSQNFQLSWYRDLRIRFTDTCLDAHNLVTQHCHLQKGNQLFTYDQKSQQIVFINGFKCIEGNPNNQSTVVLEKCDSNHSNQKWTWGFVNQTAFVNNR